MGKAVLPLRELLAILKATKEKSLALLAICSAKTARIDVTGEQEKYALEAPASADEFPDVIPFQSKAYHEFPVGDFQAALQRTIVAAEKPETSNFTSYRPIFSGVCFGQASKAGVVDVVATDGRRMAWQTLRGKCIEKHTIPQSSVVPQKPLNLLGKVLKEIACPDCDAVKMVITPADKKYSPASVCFYVAGVTIHSALMNQGKFPEWRSICTVDKETPHIILNPSDVPPVLDRLTIAAKLKKEAKLTICIGNNGLTFVTDAGGTKSSVVCPTAGSCPQDFNGTFMVDLANFLLGMKAVQQAGTEAPITMYVHIEVNPLDTKPERSITVLLKSPQKGYSYVMMADDP